VSDTLHNALESLRRQRAQEEKRDYSLSEIVEENLWQTLKLEQIPVNFTHSQRA
jgi:hypothetical protein